MCIDPTNRPAEGLSRLGHREAANAPPVRTLCRSRFRARRGFTLIEAAIVTVIVGVGVLATVELLASGTVANTEATRLTTAMHLAGNIREAAMRVPYTSVFALEDTYSPAVDATLAPIESLQGWEQVVDVQNVDPNRLTLTIPDDPNCKTAKVVVTVKHNGKPVYTTNWIAAASE
jgi:prepilin-type N-terminal cleavage/methylation domain-containing protein